MIRRENKSLIAHPETIIMEEDYVTIIGKNGAYICKNSNSICG